MYNKCEQFLIAPLTHWLKSLFKSVAINFIIKLIVCQVVFALSLDHSSEYDYLHFRGFVFVVAFSKCHFGNDAHSSSRRVVYSCMVCGGQSGCRWGCSSAVLTVWPNHRWAAHWLPSELAGPQTVTWSSWPSCENHSSLFGNPDAYRWYLARFLWWKSNQPNVCICTPAHGDQLDCIARRWPSWSGHHLPNVSWWSQSPRPLHVPSNKCLSPLVTCYASHYSLNLGNQVYSRLVLLRWIWSCVWSVNRCDLHKCMSFFQLFGLK